MSSIYLKIIFYIPKEESSCEIFPFLTSTGIIQRDIPDFYTSSISKPPGIFKWKELENQFAFNERSKIIVFHSSYIMCSSLKGKIQRKSAFEQIKSCFLIRCLVWGWKSLFLKTKFWIKHCLMFSKNSKDHTNSNKHSS